MPTLPTQSFNTIVSNTVAGIQGRASALVNFAIGSTLRAVAEGFGGVFLWFQALVLQLLTSTRLATCVGNDVDTWTVDLMPAVAGSVTAALPNGSPRLGAQAATGLVTFTRFTAGPSTCFIAVGDAVKTTDRSQTFAVTADTANVNYSAILNGYTLAADVASIDVPVQAQVAGAGGNVVNGAISVIATPITGIDTVSNSAAFTNGEDQETDAQLKARFKLYIQSLQKASEGAIGFAIASVQAGMQWQILENLDPGGGTDYGAITVYVDDGSGAIPAATLLAAQNAVQAVRAAGVRAQVLPATTLLTNPTMTITTAAGYDHPTVVAQVVAALGSYINGVGLGNKLSYFALGSVAIDVTGVTDVTNYTLNGVASDLVPAAGQTIKSGNIVVS